MKLEKVNFIEGLLLKRELPALPHSREALNWFVIGTYGSETFMLYYQTGYTNWYSNLYLDENVRKKILTEFKKERRDNNNVPAWIQTHDLRVNDRADFNRSSTYASKLSMNYIENNWRKKYEK